MGAPGAEPVDVREGEKWMRRRRPPPKDSWGPLLPSFCSENHAPHSKESGVQHIVPPMRAMTNSGGEAHAD